MTKHAWSEQRGSDAVSRFCRLVPGRVLIVIVTALWLLGQPGLVTRTARMDRPADHALGPVVHGR